MPPMLGRVPAIRALGRGVRHARSPQADRGALVFDPLEPRVLLNADVLAVQLATMPNDAHDHSVIVRMINETVQVGAQGQSVQQVEVLDAINNNATLAIGDLSQIGTVAIQGSGSSGAETVEIDADSFGANTLPAVQFSGGSGPNALVIDNHGTAGLTWQINGDGSGTVTGTVSASFTNVSSLVANGATNTLDGPASPTTWNVTGLNAGTVDGTTFSGFANLQGAAGNPSTFVFSGMGDITGVVAGGSGGYNTVKVAGGRYQSESLSADSGSSGNIVLDGATIAYTGMSPIDISSGAADVTIDLDSLNNNVTLSGSGGTLTLSDPGGAETQHVADPTNQLTIEVNSIGTNTVTIDTLGSFAAGLEIDGTAGTDTVEVAGSIVTNGHAFTVDEGSTSIANALATNTFFQLDSGASINTTSAASSAGAINITSKNITLQTGSALLAAETGAAATEYGNGVITLIAPDTAYRQVPSPIFFSPKSVNIDVTGATIDGGNVSIIAESSDALLGNDIPVQDSAAAGLVNYFNQAIDEIPGAVLSQVLPIGFSTIVRGANAGITLDDTTINSTGAVDVTSTIEADTLVYAIANQTELGSQGTATADLPFDAAAGFAITTGTVTAELTDGTSINAVGNVSVSADGSLSAKTIARATDNETNAAQTVDTTAVSAAIAFAYSTLTSTASLSANSAVTSTAGSVNIQAEGSNKVQTDASTYGPVDATAGTSIGIGYSAGTITTEIDGTIKAAGNNAPAAGAFNAGTNSVVNLDSNSFDIPGNTVTTGEPLVYSVGTIAGGGTGMAIGGLTNGQTYYAIVTSPGTFQLADAPVLALDPSGTDPISQQTLQETLGLQFQLDAIDTSDNAIFLPDDGFNNGDQVVYTVGANSDSTAIGGLTAGDTYTVQVVDTSDFQLMNNGTVVQLSTADGAGLGVQIFTDITGTTVAAEILGFVDSNANTIDLPDYGLSNGQIVTYMADNSDASDPIGALQSGDTYTVQTLTADQFALLSDGTLAPVSDPGAASMQELDVLGTPETFTPAPPAIGFSNVNTVADTISLANSAVHAGDTVTYGTLSGSTAIGGLTAGDTYTVGTVSGDSFTLLNGGSLVGLTGPGSGTQYFVDGTSTIYFAQGSLDVNTDTFYAADDGLATGETVTYTVLPQSGTAAALGGLTSGQTYTVTSVGADAFTLTNAGGTIVQPVAGTAGVAAFTLTPIVVNPTDDGIFLPGNTFQTGEEVNYNVDPNLSTTATTMAIDASGSVSALPVTVSDQEINGLTDDETYFVVVVDPNHIRLADSYADAMQASPIPLTSLGTGTDQTLTPDGGGANGIGVTASLSSTNYGKAKPEIGSKTNPSKIKGIVELKPDALIATVLGNYQPTSALGTGKAAVPTDPAGNAPKAGTPLQNNSVSFGGGFALNIANDDVQATIGSTATLDTPDDIKISSTASDKTQALVVASVSKPKNSGGYAVGLAFSLQIYTNTADATIDSNAVLNAGGMLTLNAAVDYPFLVTPLTAIPIYGSFPTKGISAITDFLDGTGGFDTDFNTWITAQAKAPVEGKAPAAPAPAISGAINVSVLNDTADAIIESGALINQTTADQTSKQAVSITAGTTIDLLQVGGTAKFSLNEGPYGKIKYESKTAEVLAKDGDFADVFGRSGASAVGGALLITSITGNTEALIDPRAQVHVGAASSTGLSLTATEMLTDIEVDEAGGLVTSNDATAFSGSAIANGVNSTTLAGLVSDGTGGVTVTGGGPLNITATTGGVQVAIAGALIVGDAGDSGVGVSAIINAIIRVTDAFIGANPTITSTVAPAAADITASAVTLNATTTGAVAAFTLAGIAISDAPPQPNTANAATGTPAQTNPVAANLLPAQIQNANQDDGDEDASSATGVAGAGVGTGVNDTTSAVINAAGTAEVSSLTQDATDESLILGIAGALSVDTGSAKNKAIAGAFDLNVDITQTEATLQGLSVQTGALPAGHEVSLSALQIGTVVALSAAVSADTSADSSAFAGSLTINVLTNTTQALVEGATTINAGDLFLTATEGALVVVIGGAAAVADDSSGVGASLAYDQISSTTMAGVMGLSPAQSQITLAGGLTVLAEDTDQIDSVAVSAGVGSGDEGSGVAFTLAINIIAPTASAFTHDNADALEATITNATVANGGTVSLTAEDNSNILSIAGALAVGADATAYGAGASWNQVALSVNATIDGAVVTAGGAVSLLAESLATNDAALGGKIVAAAVSGEVSTTNTATPAVGAAVSVDGVINTIYAGIEDDSTVDATGAVTVSAQDTAIIRTLVGGLAISLGAGDGQAVGAAVGADYIDNIVMAEISASTVMGSAVTVEADEGADIGALTLGLAGGASSTALGGSVSIDTITDAVTADISGASSVHATGTVDVAAGNTADITATAGAVGLSADSVAVGAALTTVVVVNTNNAFIAGDAIVVGTTGVAITATTSQGLADSAIGAAVSNGEAAGAGSVTVTGLSDTTQAYVSAPDAAALSGASVMAGTGSGTTGNVVIMATSVITLIGTAGAIAGSNGGAAVGVGADAGGANRKTLAYVGAGATVRADGSVIIEANANERVVSNSIAGAAATEAAVSATAGISALILTTQATIDSNAMVFSRSNVVVTAEDDTTVYQLAGSVAISAEAAVGVGLGIATITKNTDATISSGAQVTGLALGDAATVNTAGFTTADGSDVTQTVPPVTFDASAVGNGGTIDAPNNGLQTGEEVSYTPADKALGNLTSGQVYYVISLDANHFELARTLADATNGNAIMVSQGMAAAGDVQTITPVNGPGTPVPSVTNLDTSGIGAVTVGPEATASRSGVIVVAASTNMLENTGAAVAVSDVAVPIGGAIAVHTINTVAQIAAGAQINANNSGASYDQSVYVDAARAYQDVTVGFGAAGAGSVAVAPGVAVPVLAGVTEALITGPSSGTQTVVNAKRDVEVVALADENIVAVAVGIAVAGLAGVGGSVAVIAVNTTTEADIAGNAVINALGNVLVAATDNTTDYAIAGALGIGATGAAGAGAFAVTQLNKTTDALIEAGAVVNAEGGYADQLTGIPTGAAAVSGSFPTDAIKGVAVSAASTETVTDGAGSGAGGLFAGLAGAVTVELLTANTLAAIRSGAQINQMNGGAGPEQSVAVTATDTVTEVAVAGALGASGVAGVGAGIDVAILRDDTQAVIDDADVQSVEAVRVAALSLRDLSSTPIAVGAGGLGLGGGISVLSIGGDYSSNYSATDASGNSATASATSANGSDALSQTASGINTLLTALETPSGGGLPPINPATAVNASAGTIDFGTATGLTTGEAVVYSSGSGAPIDGLTDGDTYFVITDGSDDIQLATSYDNALAGIFIPISATGATGTAHTFTPVTSAGTSGTATASETGMLPADGISDATASTQTDSGTTAAIQNGASINAGTLSVLAQQTYDIEVHAGGFAIGGAAIGVGIAVVTMQADVSSYIGPGVAVFAQPDSGAITVAASRTGVLHVVGIAGAYSGFAGLGAAVAAVSDTSNTTALIGASVDDGAITQGTTATPTTVTGEFFLGVTVSAYAAPKIDLATGAGALGGVYAGAAAITSAGIGGNVVAEIGNNTTIGSQDQPTFQGVTVAAERDAVTGPYTAGQPEGIGLAGGFLADAAGVVAETISGNVVAAVGNDSTLFSIGTIAITANGTVDAGLVDEGGAVGALAVGEMVGSIALMGTVQAGVGADSTVDGPSVTVAANGTNTANALVYPAGGGIVSGSGGNSGVTLSDVVAAQIGSDATITATAGTVAVTASSDNDVEADDGTVNLGGVAIGGLVSSFVVNDTVQATIGADALITAATNVSVLATSYDQADTSITGGGGGLVGVEIANSTRSITVDTATEIGAGATIAAGDSLTVEAQSTITSTVIPQLTAGGFGAGANVTASVTVQNTTTTAIDPQAMLTAQAIEILADVANINVSLQPLATVDAFIGGDDATSDLSVTSIAQTTIGQGATLIGTLSVDVAALQDELQVVSKAQAQANAIGGGQAFAPVTLNATTALIGAAGALVRTQSFSARANAVNNPTVSSTTIGSAFGFDIYGTDTESLTYNRSITWNSTVIIVPANNVVSLTVSPTDAITTQGNISGEISGSTIVVNAVTNDPSAPGSILFDIAPSTADAGSGGTAVISGTPTLEVASGIGTLDITNQSALTLALNEINLSAPDTSMPDLKVNVTAGVQTNWMPVILGIANGTSIDVESATVGSVNVLLGGDIDNPLGQTVINAGNNIVASGHTIDSAALTLEAGSTAGTAAAPILVTGTTLSATVTTGGLDVLATGTVAIAAISVAGAMVLQAGSIVAVPGAGGILAGSTTLTAESGGIGTTALPVIVGAPGTVAPLTAMAADGIVIQGGTDGLAPQMVQASGGDVLLEASGLPHTQQDITLSGTGAYIRSVTGNVTLSAGESIITGPYTTIQATGSVNITSTTNNVNMLGGTIALAGVIDAPQVVITNYNQPGAVSLTNSSPGTKTTIRLAQGSPGDAVATVLLGSDATPTSDTGGVLRYFFGAVMIDGTGQDAVVLLDDSGDLVNQTGTLNNGVLTGLGVAAGLTVSSVGTLQIALGSNTQTLDVEGVPAGTTVPVLLGSGPDTIDVGTAGHSLANIQGLLTLQGSVAVNDMLVIDDSSDTRATQAVLAGNALEGLGMGSASPTIINASAGIQFHSFGSITITLGSGDNTLSINGVGAATTLNTAAGDDVINLIIGQPFAGYPLLVTSTPGSGTELDVQAEIASDLVLGQQNSATGLLTDTGGLGIDIAFSGQSLLFIQQTHSLDELTINATVLPTDVVSEGANALVTVLANSQSLMIALQGSQSAVDILGAGAAVSVIGDGSSERLSVDLQADTTNVAGTLVNGVGAYADGGVLEGALGGTLAFMGLAEFEINFGSGNAALTLDETIPETAIVVDGGTGDNNFTVQQFADASPLGLDGSEGPTTVTLDVTGVPTIGEFSNVTLDQVATLVINNSSNTTTGVDWLLPNRIELSAAVGNGAPFEVIGVVEIPTLEIVGGLAQSDTLQISAITTSTQVQATLSGDSVALNFDQVDNVVSFSGIGTLDLTTGGGPDLIVLAAAPTSELTTENINAGNGANTLAVAALARDTIINTGTDADTVMVGAALSGNAQNPFSSGGITPNATLTVNTGAGDDTVYIATAGSNDIFTVSTGPDPDQVTVFGPGIAPTATLYLHGNDPANVPAAQGDNLILQSSELGYNLVPTSTSSGSFNAYYDDYSNTGTVYYDTFEGITTPFTAQVVPTGATIQAGQSVSLSVGSTLNLSGPPQWNINQSGSYGEVTGYTIDLSWSQLESYGVNHPGTFLVGAELDVTSGGPTYGFSNLVVTPVNPTLTVTGATTATVGTAYTVDFAATEPDNAAITGWQVNWGDGSAVQDFGANATSAAHIYNVPTSDATVRVSAADTAASAGSYPYAATPIAVDVSLPASFTLSQSYTIIEGQGVTLIAPSSLPGTPTSYTWKIGTGAVLGSGATLMVTAATLANYVLDFGTYPIDLVLGYPGGGTVTDTTIDPQTGYQGTALVVLEAPPIATVTPGGTVVVGNAGTFLLTGTAAAPLQEEEGFLYHLNVIDLSSPVGQVGTLFGVLTLAADNVITVPASLLKTPGTYEAVGTLYNIDLGTAQFVDDIFVVAGTPTLAVSGSANSVEGQTYDLTIGVTGDDTVSGYLVNWGDGITQMVAGGDAETATHVFLQNGPLTLDVTAFDATATFAASKTVTVANVAPTLALTQSPPTPQGSLSVLAGTITDPGPDDQFAVAITWGDGTGTFDLSLAAGVTSFATGHLYAGTSAVGIHTIDATVTDDNGATGSANTLAVVTSVPVSITALGFTAPLNPEGDTATLVGLASGTGPLQAVTVTWGDGSTSAGTVVAGTDTFIATHVYANNPAGEPIGSFVATATLTDAFGNTATATADAVVENEPPVVGAITVTSTTVAQGVAVSVSALFSDPGTLDTHTAIINWGDGTQSNATVTESKGAGTITAMHTFDSGSVDLSTMTVIDNDGGTAFVTLNAVPSINNLVASQPTINEGGAITLSGTVSDPMGSASADTVSITWGDGDTTQATINPSTDAFSVSHTYLDNPAGQPQGSYSILAAVSNALGQSSTAAAAVQVNNVAPSVTKLKLNATDINEGSAVTLSGTIVDPGVLDSETVSIVWGDGNTTATTVNRSTRAFTATHTYLDNPAGEPDGSYTIVVTATDNAGAQGTADASVEVQNVAPSIKALATNAGTVAAASAVTVTGTVVDPGVLDSETVSVTWGDGTTSAATVNRTTRVLSATHSYAAGPPGAAAEYSITATAMDNSGAAGQAQLVIQVNTPASIQNAVVLAAEPLTATASTRGAAIATTTTSDPPATTAVSADPLPSSDPAPLTSVAIAPVQPGQMIALVKSSTIKMRVSGATQATGAPASAPCNLMFDEAADRFVAAQNAMEEMTASLNLVTTSMVDDYGEDWLLIGSGGTGKWSPEQDIRHY